VSEAEAKGLYVGYREKDVCVCVCVGGGLGFASSIALSSS
jgi:hypothetical protein